MRSLCLCVWKELSRGQGEECGGSVHFGGMGRGSSESCWGSIGGQGTGEGLAASPIVTK